MVKNTTVIRLLVSTKDRLDSLGKKNESYDDIIQKLLDQRKLKKELKE